MTTQNERAERQSRNAQVIAELRANGGKSPSRPDTTLLILTTTGAKSGRPFTTPLAYLPEGDGWAIFASKAGAPTSPDWYHNLVAHPDVTIEVDGETIQATARVATGAERDEIYARQAKLSPIFGEYQTRTTRTIPVVVLTRRAG